MKKTLQEEKERISNLIEQSGGGFIDTPSSNKSPIRGFESSVREIYTNQKYNGALQINDHIFCPTHTLNISVGDGDMEKDEIMFTVKIFPDTKIIDVDFNENDYDKKQVEQAKQMVLQALSKTMWPAGCSFSLKNPKGNNSVEF